ncbi:MAG TPA: hypothetical protein VK941_00665 [Gillisia sp.]|nr:hypothetical protein [Gillisia sp.]
MEQKLHSIFLFYRRFFVSSFIVNILLLLLGISFAVAATIKILFFALLLFINLTTKQKEKLTFYHNLSISTFFLFGMSLLLDLLLLFVTYLIIGYVY